VVKVLSINHKRPKVTTPVKHDGNLDLKRILKNIKQSSISIVVNLLMRTADNATFVTSEIMKTVQTRKDIFKGTRAILAVVTFERISCPILHVTSYKYCMYQRVTPVTSY
jgi:hypothetical protein